MLYGVGRIREDHVVMAIVSDFFAASPHELTPEVLQQGPTGTFPFIARTSLTTLALASLLPIVRGGSLDDGDAVLAGMDEFEDVGAGGPEGPWLNRFPDALRLALAAASEDDIAVYAARWAEAEELAGIDLDTVTSLLQDLCSLARAPPAPGKELYLWVNL